MVSYLVIALLATLVAMIAAAIYTVRRTKTIVIFAKVMSFMTAIGFVKFMHKTGLNKRMRPEHGEVTLPSGARMTTASQWFEMIVPEILELKVREDDVYIVTYPKAGTTWLQEIVWLMCHDADFAWAKSESLQDRVPFSEGIDMAEGKGIQSIQTWPKDRRRLIKTHQPYEFLPDELKAGKKCKIVYLARNPKDLCVSYHHFYKMNAGMPEPGTWSEFLNRFCSGQLAWGSWFDHTLGYWKRYQEKDQRIYFTTYEKLKKDLRKELVPLAEFLGKDLSDKQLDAIADHCSFESMSKNDKVNYAAVSKVIMDFSKSKFMRKGQVGDWKNYFTLNQNEAFDELFEKRMKNSGLEIEFEI